MNLLDRQLREKLAGETKAKCRPRAAGRLAAEFGTGNTTAAAPGCSRASGPYARMLSELLASIGWEGSQHRILEALPYLSAVKSVGMLRAVLARLDVDLIPTDRDLPTCRPQISPAFWSARTTGAIWSRPEKANSWKSTG